MRAVTVLTVALVIQEVLASCPSSTLAVYRLQLATHWTEENFPKQYPQWRPPAQWSKTVGFTHTDQFQLYKVGTQAVLTTLLLGALLL